MNKDIAISVKNARPVTQAIRVTGISKTFHIIPHEKVSSLRGVAVSAFSKNKGYEEFKVYPVTSSIVTGTLDDVSFEACPTHYNSFLNCCGRVKKREFFGIIGRSGSGKSTLLKILAGIYQPDKVLRLTKKQSYKS